ncbi:lysostaphin resistance A-like protein [Micropruina sp.]|uniref:CPBP family intramembrane glutamic endopeptidase n=1 Tax=Micropruina sp. TaxID=2737536 RepID=UPI0039E6CBAE
MDLVTTLLVGVPGQVAVFALVPLAYWLNASRPEGSLLRWLGFRQVCHGADPLVLAATALAALGFVGSALLGRPGVVVAGSGYFAWLAVVLVAVVQTALSEELFFRGFMLNWLGGKRGGAVAANAIQALCCGALRFAGHWVFIDRGLGAGLAVFALGVGSALMVGWVRQRTASLLLPWAAHGSGNLIAGLIGMISR